MATGIQAFKAAGLPVVDMGRFKQAVQAGAMAARQAAMGSLLLRMLRDGMWVYGPDNVEVQDGSLWAVNPFSMSMGWACWGDEKGPNKGKLLSERMALLTEPQYTQNELPAIDGEQWNAQVQFDLVCLNGDDEGTSVRYKSTSVGGKRAFAGMLQEVSAHADGDGMIVPVVSLLHDSYMNKTYGKTYVPVFEVAEWRAPDDTTSVEQAEGEEAKTTSGDAPATSTQASSRRPPVTNGATNASTRSRRAPVGDAQASADQQEAAAAQRVAAGVAAAGAGAQAGATVRRRRRAAAA